MTDKLCSILLSLLLLLLVLLLVVLLLLLFNCNPVTMDSKGAHRSFCVIWVSVLRGLLALDLVKSRSH